jgi:hypothetical protein
MITQNAPEAKGSVFGLTIGMALLNSLLDPMIDIFDQHVVWSFPEACEVLGKTTAFLLGGNGKDTTPRFWDFLCGFPSEPAGTLKQNAHMVYVSADGVLRVSTAFQKLTEPVPGLLHGVEGYLLQRLVEVFGQQIACGSQHGQFTRRLLNPRPEQIVQRLKVLDLGCAISGTIAKTYSNLRTKRKNGRFHLCISLLLVPKEGRSKMDIIRALIRSSVKFTASLVTSYRKVAI